MIAASTSQVGMVLGIVLGPSGLIAGYIALRKLKPEDQTLVMSANESGVNILNSANAALMSVVHTLEAQVDRAQAAQRHSEELLDRCVAERRTRDEYIRELQTILNERGGAR